MDSTNEIDYVVAVLDKASVYRAEALRIARQLIFQDRYTSIKDGVLRWMPSFEIPTDNVLEYAFQLGLPVDVQKSIEQRGKENPLPTLGDLRAGFGSGGTIANMIVGKIYERGD